MVLHPSHQISLPCKYPSLCHPSAASADLCPGRSGIQLLAVQHFQSQVPDRLGSAELCAPSNSGHFKCFMTKGIIELPKGFWLSSAVFLDFF